MPELCIEVVSERVAYDRTLKRVLYTAGGVQEFWAVFPERAVVEQWSGPRLERRENIEGLLASALLPGFQLDVRCLRVE